MKQNRRPGRLSEKEEAQELVGRELAILEVIRLHPDWHYSKLREYFVDKGIMAGQTFHNTIRGMVKQGKVLSIRRGPWNREYFHEAPTKSTMDENEFRKAMDYSLAIFDKLVTNFIAEYRKLSRTDKAIQSASLVDELFRNINGLALRQILKINKKSQCEKYEMSLRNLVGRVIDAVRNDADAPTVSPYVMLRIMPTMFASEQKIRTTMNRVLE